jgi:hypothetical protein
VHGGEAHGATLDARADDHQFVQLGAPSSTMVSM